VYDVRRHLFIGLAGIAAMVGAVACSSAPNSQARACSAKTQMQTALNDYRSFDFTNPNAGKLADILDSMIHPLKNVEGAVHLPQDTRLNELGGVGHLRQLERELNQFSQQLRNAHANNQEHVVFIVRPALAAPVGQVQQVADAITGC
jgi:hypothetical protein